MNNLYLSQFLGMFAPVIAYAEESGDFVTALQNIANTILGTAQNIVLPICAILIVWFGIKLLIASDAQSVAKAKQGLLIAVVGALIVFAAPQILKLLISLLGDSKSSNFDWTVK